MAGVRAILLVLFALQALQQTSLVAAYGYRNKALRKPIIKKDSFYNHVPPPLLKPEDIPREFNWCNVNGTNLCTASWNQHVKIYCGACWAHATLSALQDRLKIIKRGMGTDVMLGRQTLLNCAAYKGYGHGCDGGDTIDVFRYMTEYGLPDETCMPYSATDHTKFSKKLKTCPYEAQCQNCMPVEVKGKEVDMCWAIKKPVIYYLTSYGLVGPKIEDMYSEILARGPIVCGMDATEDLAYNYKGGVYRTNATAFELDHDVEIVGWGMDEETDVPYWLIRNSWGAFWGELGFFRLERGVDALGAHADAAGLWGIESGDCWYGVPENNMEQRVEKGELVGSMYGLVSTHHGPSTKQGKEAVQVEQQHVMLTRASHAASSHSIKPTATRSR